MRSTIRWLTLRLLLLPTICVVIARVAHAQPPSRVIPFVGVNTTIPPGSPDQTLQLQVWDAATGGTQVFTETHTLAVESLPLDRLQNRFPIGSGSAACMLPLLNHFTDRIFRLPSNRTNFPSDAAAMRCLRSLITRTESGS